MTTESDDNSLIIEAGKKYLCFDGNIVGPLIDNHEDPSGVFPVFRWSWNSPEEGWLSWTAEGRWNRLQKSRRDLWKEWPEGDTMATATATEEWLKKQKQKQKFDSATETPAPAGTVFMTKQKLLDLAKQATADRGLNYGKPENNFKRIADLWTAHLANRVGPTFLTPTDVAIMCALLKVARLENEPGHLDSWVDLAGYAACGAEIALASQDAQDTSKEPSRG